MSDSNVSEVRVNWDAYEEELNEGKRNVKWGVGIGAASAASMALIGATCPLCFVVAPAFVGVGMWKKRKAKQKMSQSDETVESEDSTASS